MENIVTKKVNYDQSKLIGLSKRNAKKKKGIDYDMQGKIAERNRFTSVAFVEIEEKTKRYLSMTRSKGD